MHFTLRDNEDAYVSVNGETCWNKTLTGRAGTHQCGQIADEKNPWFKEEAYQVTGCEVVLSGSGNRPLTVRVWTTLDEHTDYESFGIDDVVVQRIQTSAFYVLNTIATCDTRMHTIYVLGV